MQYTYSNEKSVSYSTIDFWRLSSVIMQYVSLYSTIDSAICFSDHLPIRLLVALPADNSLASCLNKCRDMFRGKTKQSGQGAGAQGIRLHIQRSFI